MKLIVICFESLAFSAFKKKKIAISALNIRSIKGDHSLMFTIIRPEFRPRLARFAVYVLKALYPSNKSLYCS